MSESWTGESAERKEMIDIESGYFRAQSFTYDLVQYLQTLKMELLDDGYSETEVGMAAIEDIRELCHVIKNEKVSIFDQEVKTVVDSEDLSPEWARVVFSLLKKADYSKSVVKTWLLLDEPFLTSDEEVNKGRSLNSALDEVYGKD